mmetsp:Transcript_329/g.895  ORF Transcript_329/g.895 Transcript_329/m.895 type:complete len:229 (+) Transcript_329:675-1361(+)
MLLSLPQVARSSPSGDQATSFISLSWPSSVTTRSHSASVALAWPPLSQMHVVASKLTVAIMVSHLENSHLLMVFVCVFSKVSIGEKPRVEAESSSLESSFVRCHNLTVLSPPQLASVSPWLFQHTCQTRSLCPSNETPFPRHILSSHQNKHAHESCDWCGTSAASQMIQNETLPYQPTSSISIPSHASFLAFGSEDPQNKGQSHHSFPRSIPRPNRARFGSFERARDE